MLRSPAMDALRAKYGAHVNFIIHYDVDDDNSKHALSLATFGEKNEWVLLETA